MTIDEITIRRAAEKMHAVECGCEDSEHTDPSSYYAEMARTVAPIFREEYRMLVHDQDALEVSAWKSGFAAGKHEGMHSGANPPLGRCDFTREEGFDEED